MNMYKKQILIGIIAMILLVTPIYSVDQHQYFYDGDIYSFDPSVQEWYDVAEWELELCRVWGGTAEAYNVVNGPTYLSETTVTLQGQKSEKMPDNTTMYEVAWYLESGTNKTIE